MPGQQRRSSPPRHHPRTAALFWGTLAVLGLALSACGNTTPVPVGAIATTSPDCTSAGPGARPSIHLTGAGSTFVAPFFCLAFSNYSETYSETSVKYSAVGSSAGIAGFSAGHLTFGASDVPMTAAQQAAARGGPSVQVPDALSGVAVVYHLGFPGTGSLHLTGPVTAQIFLGQITRWNDPAIAALNPGADLPDAQIHVVHRSDGSGTTYIFSDYLSRTDPAWASRLRASTTIKWPVGTGAVGNAGVAGAVSATPYSIGYIEQSYRYGLTIDPAAIQNQAGQYLTPTTASIAVAAAQKTGVSATNFSIVNEPGAGSYPISGYSWALIYVHQPNEQIGLALVRLMEWVTHTGQNYAGDANYVPLPPAIQALATTMLQQVRGPNGQPLLS